MSHNQKIWVIDDDNSIRWVLEKALQKAGMEVASFESGTRALQALQKEEPAVIISDIRESAIPIPDCRSLS
jgi:two-component system nitrogen regulation response regulator GlnG